MKKDEKLSNNESREKKNILLLALKRHKISLAIVLFFICATSTFAWFIYNKTVNFGLQAHVKAWDIQLGDGSGDTYTFAISDLYPGMPDATDSVNIINGGEMAASLSMEVKSLKLFGEDQVLGTDYTVTVNNGVYTINGYPFTLTFSLSGDSLNPGALTTLVAELKWDYANSEAACQATDPITNEPYNKCDEEDTEMGERSYEYSQANPNGNSIEIVLKLQFVEQQP